MPMMLLPSGESLASTLVIAYLLLLITKITGRPDGFCGMLMTFRTRRHLDADYLHRLRRVALFELVCPGELLLEAFVCRSTFLD
jgi:hypothetical protein